MNNLNPVAFVFWALCATIGYLINGTTGLAYGLAIGFGISLLGGVKG